MALLKPPFMPWGSFRQFSGIRMPRRQRSSLQRLSCIMPLEDDMLSESSGTLLSCSIQHWTESNLLNGLDAARGVPLAEGAAGQRRHAGVSTLGALRAAVCQAWLSSHALRWLQEEADARRCAAGPRRRHRRAAATPRPAPRPRPRTHVRHPALLYTVPGSLHAQHCFLMLAKYQCATPSGRAKPFGATSTAEH